MTPSRRDRIYLDWNATTPPAAAVIDAMGAAARDAWGNPSSVHAFGRAGRARVEHAREAVARLAQCDPRDVVLTSGGTEANNLALRGAFAEGPGVLITSRAEHPSVTRVAEALAQSGRVRVRWLRVLGGAVIDLADLDRALGESAREGALVVAVQAVNAETGAVQPVRDVIDRARRSGARVHVDAVQAFGRLDDVAAGADTRSLAGHKMRGPKAIGALVTSPSVTLSPVLLGGSQERGLRPGTTDPVAAAGLAAAAELAMSSPERYRATKPLRDRLEAGLIQLYPRARVNGASTLRAPHVASVAFPGWSGPELVAAFDIEGIAVSSGTACSAGTSEPSPVLIATGDVEAAACTVRFSLGEETSQADVDVALVIASRVLARR